MPIRNKTIRLLSLLGMMVILFSACGWFEQAEPDQQRLDVPPTQTEEAEQNDPDPIPDAEDRSDTDTDKDKDSHGDLEQHTDDEIELKLQQMTIEEKIGQLVMIGIEGEELQPEAETFITEHYVGGVILYGRNLSDVDQTVELVNDLKLASHNTSEIPLLISIDEEGGLVTRLPDPLITAPAAAKIGETESVEMAFDVGAFIGEEVSAFGMNMNFAPVLDIDSNPDNPVIGSRSLGSDAELVSSLGTAMMTGMSQHVIPVVKHFPGHGDTSVDSHLDLPVVEHDLSRLRDFELMPFQRAIAEGTDAIMVAHLLVPALDASAPATMSKPIVTGLLREELGFTGVVVTDDMTMGAVMNHYDFSEAIVSSVLAGSDQVLIGHGYDRAEAALEALVDAVDTGVLTEARIDESLRRILSLKEQYAMTDDPVESVDVEGLNQKAIRLLSPLE